MRSPEENCGEALLFDRAPTHTGASPFLNLAKEYVLPYDVVICYAERTREVVRCVTRKGQVEHGVWGKWALQRAIRIMNLRGDQRFGEFHERIVRLIDPDARSVIYSRN